MKERLRLALIGTGQIAASHLPAALATPRFEVVALVDPAAERARALAERFGIAPRIAASVGEVVGSIDAALVATPNDSHAPLALECIRAGVPVLVEKPLALSFAEGSQVVAAAEAAGVTVACGFSTRFQWNVRFMRELLRSGSLGRPLRWAYQFGFRGGWSSYTGYHLDRRAVGGGVLVTTGTHFLDRALDWFGYPIALDYEDDSLGGPEANARAGFRYTVNGHAFPGSARFSRTVQMKGGFALETELGTAWLAEDQTSAVRWRARATPNVIAELRPNSGIEEAVSKGIFRLQLEDFAAALREDRAPLVPARSALDSLRLVEELYACRRALDSDPYHPIAAAGSAA